MHDDELTRRLRNSAPDARPGDEHRRWLHLQLDHNFRHHRRRPPVRMPSVAAAAVLAVLVMTFGWSIPIGSDTFDLTRTGRMTSTGHELLKEAFGPGYRISLGEGATGQERAEMRRREIAAGAYDIVEVTGYTVDGRTYMSVGLRPWADPEYTSSGEIPEFTAEADYVIPRLAPCFKELFRRIEEDDWSTSVTSERTIAGMRFLVTTTTAEFPGVGEVAYHKGTPLD